MTHSRFFLPGRLCAYVEEGCKEGWRKVVYTKLFDAEDPNLDASINEWLSENSGFYLKNVVPLQGTAVLVLYDARQKAKKSEVDRPVKNLKPLALKAGAVSPTWEAVMRDGEGERMAPVMAGAFPVPEGFKMHPDDPEPAPPVLLAKGTDLSPYTELFGNLEKYIRPIKG